MTGLIYTDLCSQTTSIAIRADEVSVVRSIPKHMGTGTYLVNQSLRNTTTRSIQVSDRSTRPAINGGETP